MVDINGNIKSHIPLSGGQRRAIEEKKKKLEEYRASSASAGSALERGDIDGIIDPKWTRSRIVNALRMLETKRKKLPPKKHSL